MNQATQNKPTATDLAAADQLVHALLVKLNMDGLHANGDRAVMPELRQELIAVAASALADKGDEDFHHGMLAALAVVTTHDDGTIYRDIVNTVDAAKLVAVAKSDEGLVSWSGLAKYGYCADDEADD